MIRLHPPIPMFLLNLEARSIETISSWEYNLNLPCFSKKIKNVELRKNLLRFSKTTETHKRIEIH